MLSLRPVSIEHIHAQNRSHCASLNSNDAHIRRLSKTTSKTTDKLFVAMKHICKQLQDETQLPALHSLLKAFLAGEMDAKAFFKNLEKTFKMRPVANGPRILDEFVRFRSLFVGSVCVSHPLSFLLLHLLFSP